MLDAVWWPDSRRVLVAQHSKWRTSDIIVFPAAKAGDPGEGQPFGGREVSIFDLLTGYVRGYVAGVNPAYLFDPRFFVGNFGTILPMGPDRFVIGFRANNGKFWGPSIGGYLVVRLNNDGFGPPCSLVAAIDRDARADGRWSEGRMVALRSMIAADGSAVRESVHVAWMGYIEASREFYRAMAPLPKKGALLDAVGLASAIEVRGRQLSEENAWTLETLRTPEEADGLLNARYRELSAMLTPEQSEKLKAAQRRWIAFRDANGRVAEDTSVRADELQRVIDVLEWELP